MRVITEHIVVDSHTGSLHYSLWESEMVLEDIRLIEDFMLGAVFNEGADSLLQLSE